MAGRTFLTVVLFFLFCFNESVFSSDGQCEEHYREECLLKEIEKNSKYKFFYNEGLKVLEDVVSLDVKNENIDVVAINAAKGTATYQSRITTLSCWYLLRMPEGRINANIKFPELLKKPMANQLSVPTYW